MRASITALRKARRGAVAGGSVETVNSTVVGEGRRVCRRGAVVSMVAVWFYVGVVLGWIGVFGDRGVFVGVRGELFRALLLLMLP